MIARTLMTAAGIALLAAAPNAAFAAPCKDAKGKFVKCPPPAKPATTRCRLAGKFVKCGTPGAKPA